MNLDQKAWKFSSIVIFIPLMMASCGPFSGGDSTTFPASSALVQTIPPATLTAISAQAALDQTPMPLPLGLPWSEVEGLELDFWYVWDLDQPGTGMNAIVDRFNQENQWGIVINPSDQGQVLDPLGSIETAFEEGVIPHLLLSDTSAIADWYRDGLIVDLEPYLDDPAAGLSTVDQNDFYPGILDRFTLDGSIRPGFPFTQSIQVIYYNQSWAQDLGYSSQPDSWEDLVIQACSAAAGQDLSERPHFQGTGILISPEAANIASAIYAYDANFLLPGGDGYLFSSREIRRMAENWQELIREGCGMTNDAYPDPMANELAFQNFNQRKTLMMAGPALMMDHVKTGANQTGRADDWLMIPFLGPDGHQAVSAEIQAIVIFNTSPEEELASWLFLKYLASPEVQAEWVQYSKLYPTRKSSLRFLRDFRDDHPDWSQGLNLLKYSFNLPIEQSWNIVALSLGDAFEEILTDMTRDVEQQLLALDLLAAELWEYSRE